MYKVLCIDEEKNQVNKIVKMIVDSGLDFTVLKTVSTRKEALDFGEKSIRFDCFRYQAARL